jgi:hypothetical protein
MLQTKQGQPDDRTERTFGLPDSPLLYGQWFGGTHIEGKL